MGNWFKKLFGSNKCCGNCCKKEEKPQAAAGQVTPESQPETVQPEKTEETIQ